LCAEADTGLCAGVAAFAPGAAGVLSSVAPATAAAVCAAGCASLAERELGIRPVITPTPTMLNTIMAMDAVATKGFILPVVSDMTHLLRN
jgi:hypothetical protein